MHNQNKIYDFGKTWLGKFTPKDITLEFYIRVNSLIKKGDIVVNLGAGRSAFFEDDYCNIRKKMQTLRINEPAKIIGCDIDSVVMENKSTDQNILIGDDGKLPFENDSIDIIVTDMVLEHVDNPKVFCGEITRVLKSGGYLCARTPHKYNYVSIFANMLPNKLHAKLLTVIQPLRKQEDVFPTAYKLNTVASLNKYFLQYDDHTYIYSGYPCYYFGRKVIFLLMNVIHFITPSWFHGHLLVFKSKN
jgi:ubiquinone/menaquinone biosynthesis C-methylase UbiE